MVQTVNQNDSVTLMLLAWHFLALGVAVMVFLWMIFLHRRAQKSEIIAAQIPKQISSALVFPQRPATWLAIRSATPEAVQAALGLGNSIPCSWSEGMAGAHEFFISPRVNGWVIVTGLALPAPDDDVDACFLFLTALSRKLGHVQFFHAEKFTNHHAWARLDDGCVTRAYAWAGETVWNQGVKTLPESRLRLKCFDYGDDSATQEIAELNFEKVALLAARWSFDPATVDESLLDHASGTAGELSQLY
ncbi:MAG TPA: hypothetical protein VGH42_00130 [Verrucomicrobiae bacterium]